MRARRRLILLPLLLLLLAPLHCTDAEGVAEDPVEAEAEEALLAYLRIDTTNPPGNETAGAKFLQQLFAKEGIESQLVGSDPARQSLYARLPAGTNEKALLLLHHIDVVPAVASEWTKPPFAGLRSGGYLWGRGALDIKSLGIAEAMALIDLKRRKVPLKRDVVYLAVADEELGGGDGCEHLLETRPDLFANIGYVLNEGGYNETVVDKVAFWGIEVQQKVPLWLRVTTKGMPGHGASPPDDGGAAMKLVRALGKLDSIELPYRLLPSVARHFKIAGNARPVGDLRGDFMRAIREPLDVERAEKALSAGYRALLRPTIAVTRVSAGTSVNAIPATASADIDIRLLPDEKPDAMLVKVKQAVGDAAELEVLLTSEPTPDSAIDTDLYATLARTLRDAEAGSVVGPVVGAGTSDSRFFRARGITAYGIAPFKVNYYDADSVHANDERIRARFFSAGVRLMRKIVNDFCAK